jgi:hypothetical protein
LVILHSFVDYPLRTDAMMAVLAFSCALLIEPVRGVEPATERAMIEEGGRSQAPLPRREALVQTRSALPAWPKISQTADQAKENLPVLARSAGARWGEDVEWPEQWNKPKGRKSDDN